MHDDTPKHTRSPENGAMQQTVMHLPGGMPLDTSEEAGKDKDTQIPVTKDRYAFGIDDFPKLVAVRQALYPAAFLLVKDLFGAAISHQRPEEELDKFLDHTLRIITEKFWP